MILRILFIKIIKIFIIPNSPGSSSPRSPLLSTLSPPVLWICTYTFLNTCGATLLPSTSSLPSPRSPYCPPREPICCLSSLLAHTPSSTTRWITKHIGSPKPTVSLYPCIYPECRWPCWWGRRWPYRRFFFEGVPGLGWDYRHITWVLTELSLKFYRFCR